MKGGRLVDGLLCLFRRVRGPEVAAQAPPPVLQRSGPAPINITLTVGGEPEISSLSGKPGIFPAFPLRFFIVLPILNLRAAAIGRLANGAITFSVKSSPWGSSGSDACIKRAAPEVQPPGGCYRR